MWTGATDKNRAPLSVLLQNVAGARNHLRKPSLKGSWDLVTEVINKVTLR